MVAPALLKFRVRPARVNHVDRLAGNNTSSDAVGVAMQQTRQLPKLPPIGKPESYYARQVHHADRHGDPHHHEAYKVGQYVTLGLAPALSWDARCKYFTHALRRHCTPPPLPDEEVWLFYRSLADLVRHHAGQEALRLAVAKDDEYAGRVANGESRSGIADEAEVFFMRIMGVSKEKPDHFCEEDWHQLRLIRDQWL
jgi:hypothetical protein